MQFQASLLMQHLYLCRKTKVLPVPQLVTPKDWSHQPNLWDCAALLVDKPQTWTSFDVCGKLKGVLKVKKASQLLGHGFNAVFQSSADCRQTFVMTEPAW